MASQKQRQYDFETLPDRSGTGAQKWERYAGRDVIPAWVADMDFLSPPAVIEQLCARSQHGVFGYTNPYASVEGAAIDYMQRAHGVAVEREWIVWMPGLVPALNTAARAYCGADEAVMTTTPVYPPFLSAPRYQGCQLQKVPLVVRADRYEFDIAAMQSAVTDKTRVFFLCNPHNPVGRVWSRAELQQIIAFCKTHSLILVSDEIHCDLILEPELTHQSILRLDDWAYENSLTLMAPSKTYNLCGLACSFVVIPDATIRRPFRIATRGLFNEIGCLGYAGCEAAYRHGEAWRLELIEVLRENRNLLQSFFAQNMPRIRILPLEATYLAWLDVRELGLDQARQYFEDAGVGLNDGAEFGWPGYLRLNFGCPKSILTEVLARMEQAYRAIPAKKNPADG
jgi:cystathionine beta-lyase